MKKTLLFAAVLCGMTSFAVEAPTPAAVWNGDFKTSTKGDYTLSANGNTVATDGSSITVSTAKGVTFERSSALANTVGMTVIYKFDNLVVGSTVKTIATASAGGGNADRVGVNVQTSGQTSGIWANNETYNTSATQNKVSSIDKDGQFALVYGPKVTNNTGTYLFLKSGSTDYALVYSCGGLKSENDTVQAMTVGGTRNNGGTFPAASGMVIKAVALFDQALTRDQIAAYSFPEPTPKVEPIALFNFGYTTEETGWYNYHQHEGSILGPVTTNGVSFCATKDVGNFFYTTHNDFGEVNTDFEGNGTYTDIFGTNHVTVQEEIKTSLGLSDVDFTTAVYKSGQMNGGQTDHAVSISGLDATAKYVVYAGFGMLRTQYNEQVMGVQFDASGYATVEALEYIVTVAGTGTTKESRYQPFSVGTQICPGTHGLMLTRLVNVQPKADGAIALTFKGAKGGINFLAVAKVNESKPTSKTFEIAGEVSYDNLATEGLTSVTLNLTADATVTFTKAVSANLTFTGAYNLTVKGGQHLTWANITDSGVTGTRTYEISGSYTAADGLKNKIKADTTKATYVFKGTDNNGATLDFGTRAITSAIASHLVFDGGTGHSLTIGVNNGNTQLASGNTADTPFILVKGGTTLTVTTNWMTGYSLAFSSNSCIVRVNDGGTLKFNQGTTRVWYNGQLYLDPGATIDLSACGATSPDALGFNGGVLDAKQQIYVPATADGAEIGVVKITGRSLGLASDGTAGCGIFVGKNSRLEIEGFSNDSDKPAVSKYGEGELRISGNVAICNNTSKSFTIKAGLVTFNGTVSNSPVIVESGASLSGSGTISSALTLQAGSSIVVDPNARLTASSSLTLANPINLICTPQQGLTVIVPPSGFVGTGYKATLNGAANEYELYLDGGALKLKFKTPPSFTEDLGAITAVVANGKGGTVEVDISNLQKADYADSLAYTLKFGDVIVGNPEESDGKLIFTLDPSTFKDNIVYRGEFILNYEDGEIKSPITVYEGEKTFVMMETDDAVVIREQGTINDAAGETISVETKFDSDDYIDTCDSEYTVSISASEAVDAENDAALGGTEQGGVRIAEVNGALKLQVIDNGVWTDFADAAVDTAYTLTVKFHYNKGEGDEDGKTSVTYTLDKATKIATNKTDKLKVTEVFIADGTVLPANLTGLFQLDKAVIVDVEIDHSDEKPIEAKDLAAAQAIADKMVIAISEEVAKAVDATTYRGYFKVVAKQGTDGKFHAIVEFLPGVQDAIEDDIEKSMEQVVAGFETGSAEIAAKPGLYYGVKRGETLNDMDVRDPLSLAGSDGKVTITITKPEKSNGHFYRIICSPTPETK